MSAGPSLASPNKPSARSGRPHAVPPLPAAAPHGQGHGRLARRAAAPCGGRRHPQQCREQLQRGGQVAPRVREQWGPGAARARARAAAQRQQRRGALVVAPPAGAGTGAASGPPSADSSRRACAGRVCTCGARSQHPALLARSEKRGSGLRIADTGTSLIRPSGTSHRHLSHRRSSHAHPPACASGLAGPAGRRAHRQPPRAQTPATPASANAAAPRTAGGATAAWPPASSGSTRRAYSSLPPSIAASRAHISRPACAERHWCAKCRRRLADHTPRKHQQGWLVGTPGKHQPGHTRRAARQPNKYLRRWSARAARAPGARARRPRRPPGPPGRPAARTWPSRPNGGPAARPPPAPRTRPRQPRRTLPLRPLQRPRPAPRGRSVGRPRSKDRSSAAAWAASARHAWRQSGTRVRAGEQGPCSPRHVPPVLTRHGRLAAQGALRHGTQRRAGDMAGASLPGKPSAQHAARGFSICMHRRAGGSGARARICRRGAAGGQRGGRGDQRARAHEQHAGRRGVAGRGGPERGRRGRQRDGRQGQQLRGARGAWPPRMGLG